jgi:hypothetical protein
VLPGAGTASPVPSQGRRSCRGCKFAARPRLPAPEPAAYSIGWRMIVLSSRRRAFGSPT